MSTSTIDRRLRDADPARELELDGVGDAARELRDAITEITVVDLRVEGALRPRRRTALVAAAAAVVIIVTGAGALALVSERGSSGTPKVATPRSPAATSADPTTTLPPSTLPATTLPAPTTPPTLLPPPTTVAPGAIPPDGPTGPTLEATTTTAIPTEPGSTPGGPVVTTLPPPTTVPRPTLPPPG